MFDQLKEFGIAEEEKEGGRNLVGVSSSSSSPSLIVPVGIISSPSPSLIVSLIVPVGSISSPSPIVPVGSISCGDRGSEFKTGSSALRRRSEREEILAHQPDQHQRQLWTRNW